MRIAVATLIVSAGLIVGCDSRSDTGFKNSTGEGTGNQGSPAGGQTNSSFDKTGEQDSKQAGVKIAPENSNNPTPGAPTTSPGGPSPGGGPNQTGTGATPMAP